MPHLTLFLAIATLAPAPPPATIRFERAVGNIEVAARWLAPVPPRNVTRSPAMAGTAWYGEILRRLDGEGAPDKGSANVPFVAEYRDGVAERAWCDADLDGDLLEEPPLQLAGYPGSEGARSFLVDLSWHARTGGRDVPIDWTVRVVLEPEPRAATLTGETPRYRLQRVHAMLGTVSVEGRPHRAFLFDGNADGLYTREFADGLFVDLDDDGHVDTDQMSPEFGPFTVPFTMGKTSREIVEVEPDGRSITLRDLGPAAPLPSPPAAGAPAADFPHRDASGKEVRLSDLRGRVVAVYFWASWCPACRAQAEGLARLYERSHPEGFEILGVSYDTDRAAMDRFRKDRGQKWPTTFSGRRAWEDPVGRIYRVRDVGVFYLVDRSGLLDGIYTGLDDLEPAVSRLLGSGR